MSISWYITFVVVLAQRSIALEIFKMPLGHKLSRARALLIFCFFLRPHLFSLQLKVALRAAGQPGKELGIIKEKYR